MAYQPIQCEIYDYIEIACLCHYSLAIETQDGENLIGTAQTTSIFNKEEFLVFKNAKGELQKIRLDKIKSITALDDNAKFKTIEIN